MSDNLSELESRVLDLESFVAELRCAIGGKSTKKSALNNYDRREKILASIADLENRIRTATNETNRFNYEMLLKAQKEKLEGLE